MYMSVILFVLLSILSTIQLTAQEKQEFRYTIDKTWDSQIPEDNAEIFLTFSTANLTDLLVTIDAPFYNDPVVPEGIPTDAPVDGLWDYEVVEAFFLGENDEYLEIEVAPSAHYLNIYLAGVRNATNQTLPLPLPVLTVQYPKENPTRWSGQFVVPKEYFPCRVYKFNAYAIHKSDPERNYMALFPVPAGEFENPDFHRLEFFQPIKFPEVNPRCVDISGPPDTPDPEDNDSSKIVPAITVIGIILLLNVLAV